MILAARVDHCENGLVREASDLGIDFRGSVGRSAGVHQYDTGIGDHDPEGRIVAEVQSGALSKVANQRPDTIGHLDRLERGSRRDQRQQESGERREQTHRHDLDRYGSILRKKLLRSLDRTECIEVRRSRPPVVDPPIMERHAGARDDPEKMFRCAEPITSRSTFSRLMSSCRAIGSRGRKLVTAWGVRQRIVGVFNASTSPPKE